MVIPLRRKGLRSLRIVALASPVSILVVNIALLYIARCLRPLSLPLSVLKTASLPVVPLAGLATVGRFGFARCLRPRSSRFRLVKLPPACVSLLFLVSAPCRGCRRAMVSCRRCRRLHSGTSCGCRHRLRTPARSLSHSLPWYDALCAPCPGSVKSASLGGCRSRRSSPHCPVSVQPRRLLLAGFPVICARSTSSALPLRIHALYMSRPPQYRGLLS